MPLKKNLSQCSSVSLSAAAALKDSEVLAAKATIKSILTENDSLRQAVDKLQTSISQLQTQFETTLTVAEARNSHLVEQLQQQVATAVSSSLPVQSTPDTPNSPEHGEGVVRFADMHTPLPRGSVTEVFFDGLAAPTPVTRPVSWVVEQVNTQVKKLRERAELISSMQLQPGLCAVTPGSLLKQSFQGDGRLLRMQSRLSEALAVIEEQDRLIHQALLGRLQPANNKMDYDEVVDNMEGDSSPILTVKADIVAAYVDESDLLDFDVLPPASPATIQLLKECGWSVLPAEMTSLPPSSRSGRVSGNTKSLLCAKIASERLIF